MEQLTKNQAVATSQEAVQNQNEPQLRDENRSEERFSRNAETEIYTLSLHDALPIFDAKGEPLKATSYMAVGFYVAKYVNKKSDMDLAAKGLGAKEWNNSLKTKLSLLPKKLFRIRMSRNFGMKMLTMTNL